MEGVVAKRLDSPYRPGRRTDEWLKIKNVNRQELVIGGWLPGKGARAGRLGALLMGYYEPDEEGQPVLRYAGRVGTGFNEQELERLGRELAARTRSASPFAGTQPPRGARFVEPELVAEIEFRQWTHDRILRHSSYKGLREDKPAAEVRMERTVTPMDGHAAQRTSKTPVKAAKEKKRQEGKQQRRSSPRGEEPYKILRETKRATEIEVEGRTLKLTNRAKVMYPRTGFTKGELIDYYAAVAPVLLPHLAGRPLTLKRYPDGVEGEYFYEKRCPAHRPSWVRTAPIESERGKGTIDYCLAEDLPTLIWAANLADNRAAPEPLASRSGWSTTDRDRVRPRPGRSGGVEGVLPGGASDQGDVRHVQAGHVRQDLGRKGPAGLRAAQHRRSATSRPSRSRARSPSCWRSATRARFSRAWPRSCARARC